MPLSPETVARQRAIQRQWHWKDYWRKRLGSGEGHAIRRYRLAGLRRACPPGKKVCL